MEKFNNRQQNFQKIDFPQQDLRRSAFVVNLRKKKRFELQKKVREKINEITMNEEYFGPTDSCDELNLDSDRENGLNLCITPDSLPVIENCNDNSKIFPILEYIRNQLANSLISAEECVKCGIVPYVLPFANLCGNDLLKNEALWILCNIASGSNECVAELAKYGVIEIFLNNLSEQNPHILENSIWGIGNIIAESVDYFKLLIDHDFFNKILHILTKFQIPNIENVSTWTLGNSCNYDDLINSNDTKTILEACNLLIQRDNKAAKRGAIYAISILTRKDNSKISLLFETNLLINIFEFYSDENVDLCRIFGNICSGNTLQAQRVLDLGLLDKMLLSICSDNFAVVKEIYWTLSNIAAGCLEQLEILEKHPIFYHSFNGLFHPSDQVKIEASYLLSNYMKLSTPLMKKKAFKCDLMNIIKESLKFNDPQFIINAINIFEIYIQLKGKDSFIKRGYHNILDQLQTHSHPEVYNKCVLVMEKLLGIYDEV